MGGAPLPGRGGARRVARTQGPGGCGAGASWARQTQPAQSCRGTRSPPLPAGVARASHALTEVASLLLPALIASQTERVARELAHGDPEQAARHHVHLEALVGRMLAPGGWVAG